MPQVPIVMPKMSMTMTEGELLAWHCKVGDVVAAGDVVCEVATDKIDMEVEATASGTVIELRGNIGDVIEVGVPLIMVDAETDDLLAGIFDAPAATAEATPTPVATPPAAPPTVAPATVPKPTAVAPAVVNENVLATPKARAFASSEQVDLHYIAGTGRDGVIKHTDVVAAAETKLNPNRTIANRLKARNAIAKALSNSADIPTFAMTFEIEAPHSLSTNAVDRLAQYAMAWAKTLRKFPELHANWNNGELETFPAIRIALSLMAPAGVVTPTVEIPNEINSEFLDNLRTIAQNAVVGKIAIENLTASTTGLVDLGESDLVSTTAILIRPQSLAVAFSLNHVGKLRYTIAADHRISDPADVALLAKTLGRELQK